MDGLRDLGLKTFMAQCELHTAPGPNVHEIIVRAPNGMQSINMQSKALSTIPDFISLHNQRRQAKQLASSCTLVKINYRRRPHPEYHTTADDILSLFDLFSLDKAILYLLGDETKGFLQLPRDSCVPNSGYSSYFANYDHFKIAWAFDKNAMTSCGIFFAHEGSGRFNKISLWGDIAYNMRTLAPHPLFPLVVSVISNSAFVANRAQLSLKPIRQVEDMTKFNPWTKNSLETVDVPKNDIQRLAIGSRLMSATLVDIEDALRQSLLTEQALLALSRCDAPEALGVASDASTESMAECAEEIGKVHDFVEAQIHGSKIYLQYLRARAQNQFTVIFHLLTRHDAAANSRISTSMNVIAMMTMGFLPGTFFAALFAVPSLKWDGSPIIQDTFWIYWAFTIPFTVAVFILWGMFGHNGLAFFYRQRNKWASDWVEVPKNGVDYR